MLGSVDSKDKVSGRHWSEELMENGEGNTFLTRCSLSLNVLACHVQPEASVCHFQIQDSRMQASSLGAYGRVSFTVHTQHLKPLSRFNCREAASPGGQWNKTTCHHLVGIPRIWPSRRLPGDIIRVVSSCPTLGNRSSRSHRIPSPAVKSPSLRALRLHLLGSGEGSQAPGGSVRRKKALLLPKQPWFRSHLWCHCSLGSTLPK